MHVWPDHFNRLCQYFASITDEKIAAFPGADKKSFDIKLKQDPLRKEMVDTCVHAIYSARSQLKLSLAEISIAEAIDTFVAEAKSSLSEAMTAINDLQTTGRLNPDQVSDSLQAAYDEMQMVSLVAGHLNQSAFASLDVAARDVNASMRKSQTYHLHTLLGSKETKKLSFL